MVLAKLNVVEITVKMARIMAQCDGGLKITNSTRLMLNDSVL